MIKRIVLICTLISCCFVIVQIRAGSPPESALYSVAEDHVSRFGDREIVILLNYRLAKNEVQKIAEEVYFGGDTTRYRTRMQIAYLRWDPTGTLNTDYARVRVDKHSYPELNIEMLGPSQDAVDRLKSPDRKPAGTIATWFSDLNIRRYDLVVSDSATAMVIGSIGGGKWEKPLKLLGLDSLRWDSENGMAFSVFTFSADSSMLNVKGAYNGIISDSAERIP